MFVRCSKPISILFALCLLCLESTRTLLYAFTWPDTFQIHGFASQGFMLTSDNRFFGDSEDGSIDFTELGLNSSIRPIPDLQFSAQVLSRRAGKGDDGDLRLDYGFLDYTLISNESGNLGFRIGRIKNPLGFYNDTRDIAFTRPSIFLPQSIYFDRTRNLGLSSDGLNIYGEMLKTYGNFFYVFGFVYPEVDDKETRLALTNQKQRELDTEGSFVSRLMFEQDGGKIRLGMSGAIVKIKPEPTSPMVKEGVIRFSPLIFSAQYNAERWSLTSEYALRSFRYRDVGPRNFNITGESYYLQGTYRISDNLEALLRYDVLYQDRDDRSGNKFARSSGAPDHSRFAKDWTAGLRWDMTRSWMSRIEYHYVDGTAWLPLLDNPVASETDRYWHLFALLISYRF